MDGERRKAARAAPQKWRGILLERRAARNHYSLVDETFASRYIFLLMPVIRLTADGSHTLSNDVGVLYHSHHGALQESKHIFIEAGLEVAERCFPAGELRVLEIGFGTGLNAFLAALKMAQMQRLLVYHTTELYPVSEDVAAGLNYPQLLGEGEAFFRGIHAARWEETVQLSEHFLLCKHKLDAARQPLPSGPVHCVFFDAFAPEDQPELWTEAMFARVRAAMHPGAVLVTYCSKGVVRRAMETAGLTVEKLPGPPGKREIVRARA